ncbi:F-box/kelch-repeat protein At2g44130-like [Oryza brachyantha]|uniref:F-box/kelch-repeat protein At2g44130-like n=1 Tax=Oryza brachyantha TaxID=4533 RepID=UPI001ADB3F5B|nr:F-box/kelch-repeat protein At2g44130-like [Oryza brachyantha]
MGGAIERQGALRAAPWREPEAAELIPGLPDDVAMECLARVPIRSHRAMRHVCRGWRRAAASEAFRRCRRMAGAAEDVVFLVQATPARGEGKGSMMAECVLVAVNLTTGEWRRVEGAGEEEEAWCGDVPFFARCAAAGDGRHVAVVGGWEPVNGCLTRDVRVLDVHAGVWRRGEAMPDSRDFFGCAGSDGAVYVAGGHDESKNALRSAYAYDVAADAWRALPDMSEERDEPQLVATPGRVLAASGYPSDAQGAFKKTTELYTTTGDASAWADGGDMMVPNTAETCLAAVGGKVWAVGSGKGGVRDWDGAWRDVADGPHGMKACVKAVGVGDGDGDSAAAVFVFGKADDGKHAAWVMDAGGARWRRVPVPPGFGGFVYSAASVRV